MQSTHITVPLSQPAISEAEIEEVAKVLRSGWLTAGPKVVEFEEALSVFLGGRTVLAVISGTAALHMALILAGVGEGDEVITTPMTFAATANTIIMVGAKPVFVDIDPATWNLDPESVEQAITKKTKAILPVHFAGRACRMDKINNLAKEKGLCVIEDAAQAFHSDYQGKPIGSGENFVCFSFHPMKHITTGEGGALVLPNSGLLPLAKRIRFHGIEKEPWKTFKGLKSDVPTDVSVLGYKYNLSDFAAALGLVQLKRSNEFLKRRREIALHYISSFASVKGLKLPTPDSANSQSNWNLFHIVLEPKVSREAFMAELKSQGVATGIYYHALHLQSFYRKMLGNLDGKFPHAEQFSARSLALPIFHTMTDEQLEHVVHSVKKTISHLTGCGP